MPLAPDAQVFLTGTVIASTESFVYADKVKTSEIDSHKVTVVGADGIAIVKMTPAEYNSLALVNGQQIAWAVRQSPYAVGDNSGMSCKFVRLLHRGDLETLAGVIEAAAKAGKVAA